MRGDWRGEKGGELFGYSRETGGGWKVRGDERGGEGR